jgi:hypothetical protein
VVGPPERGWHNARIQKSASRVTASETGGPGMALGIRQRTIAVLALVASGALWVACGGGGGGGPSGSTTGQRQTTFIGNLRQPAALGEQTAIAGAGIVQVCVAGTSFCTEVDETGAFTLDAGVGGDVVLVFDGPGFTARLPLSGVPRGATVRIQNIECSTRTGQCQAEDVEILPPANAPPNCAAAFARPQVLWPPNHRMVPIRIDGVVDPDGDRVAITATDVVQDEPADAPGSGDTAPDAQLSPLAVRGECTRSRSSPTTGTAGRAAEPCRSACRTIEAAAIPACDARRQ